MRMVDTPEVPRPPRGEQQLPQVRPEDISYIQYTSGSTWFPAAWSSGTTALANLGASSATAWR